MSRYWPGPVSVQITFNILILIQNIHTKSSAEHSWTQDLVILHGGGEAGLLGGQHLHGQRGDGEVLPLLPLLVHLRVEHAPHQLRLLLLAGLGRRDDRLKSLEVQ